MEVKLIITNEGITYEPVLEDKIEWTTERERTPGKLTFTVIKDNIINFQEGNAVNLYVDGTPVFYGFVFTKKRSKEGTIDVTAYDQLRYLKNKDTYVYLNKKASDVIRMIAEDFRMNTGEIEDTGYSIKKMSEDNKTLFDIIQNAIDTTLSNTKKLYVLYDDFGKLTLKNIESLKTNLYIDEACLEDYDYSTSIDSNTYNKVKLLYKDADSGLSTAYTYQHGENINKWGVLQYFKTINDIEGADAMGKSYLDLYNHKTRQLTLKNCFGDLSVRAGSSIAVHLNLGDIEVQNYFLCENVKHTFKHNQHTMDIKVIGRSEFVA